jgi:ABC-type multidrug transport system ATPase subunit
VVQAPGQARDDGVTVFLTRSRLEEADLLAHRIGIIDQGRIVAEDTSAALKAATGDRHRGRAPTRSERSAFERVLGRSGAPPGRVDSLRSPCGADDGRGRAPVEVVARARRRGLHPGQVQVHALTLDDVFPAKTGRSSRAKVMARWLTRAPCWS